LEAVEFDEDSPNIRKEGRINDGRRMYAQEATAGGDNGRSAGRGEGRGEGRSDVRPARAPRSDYSRPVQVARDPFFDKPYEATVPAESAVVPSWEAAARPALRSISANIRHKVKVAALFKSS
jgi:ATP-dependent RNA helicase RhlE